MNVCMCVCTYVCIHMGVSASARVQALVRARVCVKTPALHGTILYIKWADCELVLGSRGKIHIICLNLK